jgi:hypothetical protein
MPLYFLSYPLYHKNIQRDRKKIKKVWEVENILERMYNISMPTIFRAKGYRFFFFTRENNEPIHIH